MSRPITGTRPAAIRSYVLRQGRMTKAQQHGLDVHWSRYGLCIEQGRFERSSIFAVDEAIESNRPLVLEIGFGMGDSLVATALNEPDCDFIGTEVHGPGIGHLLNLAAAAELKNLRVYRDDALKVLRQAIADHTLSRVQVFFPDPWPKKRHHKRRLVNAEFLKLVASKLSKQDGVLHLVTDWPGYARSMRDELDACPEFRGSSRGLSRCETKYERRARRLGHEIFEVVYERV